MLASDSSNSNKLRMRPANFQFNVGKLALLHMHCVSGKPGENVAAETRESERNNCMSNMCYIVIYTLILEYPCGSGMMEQTKVDTVIETIQ